MSKHTIDQLHLTKIGDVTVSTIRLHYSDDYAIAETVVFGGLFNGRGRRYESLRAAKDGHKRWVERVRSGTEADLAGTRLV